MKESYQRFKGSIFTRNLVPGESVYGESLKKLSGVEHRYWDPRRSKLAAYLKKGGKTFPFSKQTNTLYLGAASGTTVSHLSDISQEGKIFSVEVSRIPFMKLLALAERRDNIVPILVSANHPERYESMIGRVDAVYQDIAQRDQVQIFIKNMPMLKTGGTGILMVKARCIDVSLHPKKVFGMCVEELSDHGLKVVEKVGLEPHEKDHAAIVIIKP